MSSTKFADLELSEALQIIYHFFKKKLVLAAVNPNLRLKRKWKIACGKTLN